MLILALLFGMFGLFIYEKIHKYNLTDELFSADGRISIAVMPFKNMTQDTIWNVWQEGIQQTIISSLSNSAELKVIQKQNIETSLQKQGVLDYTTINPIPAGTIAKSLDANIFISGSIKQAGSRIRMDAQFR